MGELVERRQRRDAEQQRKTILGDEDAHHLIGQLKRLRAVGVVVRLTQERRYHFLRDDADVVLNHRSDPDAYQVIDMPVGSTVRKVSGSSYRTSVYRIDNGVTGSGREEIDVAFRGVDSGDYLLFLKARRLGEPVSSGRSVGIRRMGKGPDASH